MPEYVVQVRDIHAKLSCAVLDPELPRWGVIRNRLKANKWDVGGDTQAYARPTGNERKVRHLLPRRATQQVRRRSPLTPLYAWREDLVRGFEEPKPNKWSSFVSSDPEKGMESKPTQDVEMKDVEEVSMEKTEEVQEASKRTDDAGEKRPHTPRSGVVLKSAEAVKREVDEKDEAAKAAHGDSSDEEDDQLAEKLRKATGTVTLVPREAARTISEPRSDQSGLWWGGARIVCGWRPPRPHS